MPCPVSAQQNEPKLMLFICTGNTCRSPMAQGLVAKALADEDDWEVRSAGVAASVGSSESRHTSEVLLERGASLQGFRSRQVSAGMMKQASVVFCMTQGHRDQLLEEFPDCADKCYLVGDFSAKHPGSNVPDPFGMGRKSYEQVAIAIEEALPGLLRFVKALPAD